MLQINDLTPDFHAETTKGPIHFHEWLHDSWCILFSHPKDFTPVCTTELGRAAKLKHEFDKRQCKLIAISVDDLESHAAWIEDINETQGVELNFPLIADETKRISLMYGMIHPNASDSMTVRSVFIIGPDKRVKLMITYPASTGRNFQELLRVLDSLQLTKNHSVATPADWEMGEDCVVLPTVPDDQLETLFPKGCKHIKPYLRMTPQPETR